MRLLLISLLLSFMLTNCPTQGDTDVVKMNASVNPADAGVVNPPQGTYLSGRQITVETEASDERWQFTGWSGDTTASDDSLTFKITHDMQLVANYEIPTDERPILVTSAMPSEGGTVQPDSSSYELGASVDVQATANSGWTFTQWSGDTTASSNPLSLTMNKDYRLTAHFKELSKAFSDTITVTDGVNSKDVIFGMKADATAGFDSGLDVDLPPRPPSGNFYRRFNIPDYGLKEDYRAIREQETIWELEVAPESGRTITLNWDFSNTNQVGTLTLTDDPNNPSFEIDMKSQTSYSLSSQSAATVYIISQN